MAPHHDTLHCSQLPGTLLVLQITLRTGSEIEKMDPNFQAQLSPLQQQQLMQEMEKMQMKDSLT